MQRVFLSYEYQHDAARAKAVRSARLAQGGKATLESVQGQSAVDVKGWIGRQLDRAAVTIVLVGLHTASSSWVKYEIQQTKKLGKGLLAIDVTGMHEGQATGRCPLVPTLAGYALYDWIKDDGARNLASWVSEAIGSARRSVRTG